MKWKYGVLAAILTMALSMAMAGFAGTGVGNDKDKDKDKDAPAATTAANHAALDDNMRLEGERNFHANCGRCHSAPPKFAPRMAGTIVRHMRVRATITNEEMRSILRYLAQ